MSDCGERIVGHYKKRSQSFTIEEMNGVAFVCEGLCPERKEKMKTLQKKILPIAAVSFVIASILKLVSLIPLVLMPRLIDLYIPAKDYRMIILCTLAFCGIPVIAAMGFNLYQYYLMLKSRQLISEVNLQCFDKILHQPMIFFDENYSAELAQKSSQDAVSYIAVWTIDLPKLLAGAVSGVVIFFVLCRIHMGLALFQLLYIPVSLLLMKAVGGKLEGLIQKVVESNAAYTKKMQESFRSIRLIKAQTMEQRSCDQVADVQKGILKIWGKVAFFDNFMGGISNTLMPGFFYGATFVLAAVFAAQGAISIGYLTASVGYASQIHSVFTELIKTWNSFKKAKGETYAIDQYLNLEDERDWKGSRKWSFEEEMEFSDVTFRYREDTKNILEHMNLKIPKGRWIGISGASGIGKSTILELLLRFYDRNDGAVTVDGIPIEEYDLYDLRTHICYVQQDPVIVQGTIRDNLLLVKPEATEDEMREAADKTGILKEIKGGLDKEVGEGGMLLSGGEKQRIAIARCLIERKPVLFLDEVTSQMDAETQDKVVRLLKEDHDRRHTTILSVAHRREFHRYVDQEIVL